MPHAALDVATPAALHGGLFRTYDDHRLAMAAAVLGKDVDYVQRKIARGDNATERAPGDIPVYLAYFTAWPDQNGVVHYYNDVYTRDAHLKTALEKTEAARKSG